MTAKKIAKTRKVVKPKKSSKAPIYILIIAVIIIFTLLGVGLYYSLGSVNANLLLMVVVIIGATILIEFMMKRNLYFGRREYEPEETESSKPGENNEKTSETKNQR